MVFCFIVNGQKIIWLNKFTINIDTASIASDRFSQTLDLKKIPSFPTRNYKFAMTFMCI